VEKKLVEKKLTEKKLTKRFYAAARTLLSSWMKAVTFCLCVAIIFIGTMPPSTSITLSDHPKTLPPFHTQEAIDWLNSPPLQVEDLKGKVVLIDFWTYSCWNCYRSFPWLNTMEARFKDEDFIVIGVHTPEFDHERDRSKVAEKIKEFGLHHPVVIDNDHRYWQAMRNRYWPAFYVVDKQGNIRHHYVGETHEGSQRARIIEQAISQLLAE